MKTKDTFEWTELHRFTMVAIVVMFWQNKKSMNILNYVGMTNHEKNGKVSKWKHLTPVREQALAISWGYA